VTAPLSLLDVVVREDVAVGHEQELLVDEKLLVRFQQSLVLLVDEEGQVGVLLLRNDHEVLKGGSLLLFE